MALHLLNCRNAEKKCPDGTGYFEMVSSSPSQDFLSLKMVDVASLCNNTIDMNCFKGAILFQQVHTMFRTTIYYIIILGPRTAL